MHIHTMKYNFKNFKTIYFTRKRPARPDLCTLGTLTRRGASEARYRQDFLAQNSPSTILLKVRHNIFPARQARGYV